MTSGITVAVPSIAPRADMLTRALASVTAQTLPADAVSIAIDHHGDGSPATRTRALAAVQTPWVAFLDDDDEFLPQHLEALKACAGDTGADYVYSYYTVHHQGRDRPDLDPLHTFGHEFDPVRPTTTTSVVLVRTELAKTVGFRRMPGWRGVTGDDDAFTTDCVAQGAKIVHLPQRTWRWHWHARQTSGLPERWPR